MLKTLIKIQLRCWGGTSLSVTARLAPPAASREQILYDVVTDVVNDVVCGEGRFCDMR